MFVESVASTNTSATDLFLKRRVRRFKLATFLPFDLTMELVTKRKISRNSVSSLRRNGMRRTNPSANHDGGGKDSDVGGASLHPLLQWDLDAVTWLVRMKEVSN